MDYEERDEEFYASIEKKKDEIKTLDIPKKKRVELYALVNETIKRYEQIKISSLENQLGILILNKAQVKIHKELERIASMAKVTLSNLEKAMIIAKSIKSFNPPNPKFFSDN